MAMWSICEAMWADINFYGRSWRGPLDIREVLVLMSSQKPGKQKYGSKVLISSVYCPFTKKNPQKVEESDDVRVEFSLNYYGM